MKEELRKCKNSPAQSDGEQVKKRKHFVSNRTCTINHVFYEDFGNKRPYHHVRTAYTQKGKSIEERPEEAENKEIFGHWELDTVVGKLKTKSALMVMTERSKGIEIIRKIESKSQECIVRELDKLERRLGTKKFRETFKTITCDNGCENLDFKGMEKSVLTNIPRTQVFYAHPLQRMGTWCK